MKMKETTLHYVYDPLCGWCYGAAPLLAAAARLAGVTIKLHPGGLWLGERRQAMGLALRDYVKPHDERIQALTGQPFGERYFNGLLLRDGLQLDSAPPIRAILALGTLGGNELTLLQRIQESHYRDGLWVGDSVLLASLAAEQGVDEAAFQHAYETQALEPALLESQRWLTRLRGQGYPTLGLARGEALQRLDIGPYLGDVAGFLARLAD
ncbi:DsbA family protein [Aeromonas molluscorum]|jgi:putative protein-disulfide isomerase|uniref:DSBA-like thioredoxin domain-containing protein n=1 Tax=Aeromonas molluscorum 848 TaxID=1268236 RepID=R1F018_9GAMM|nr:DsbA family protein [Aeromonas molluscorum]EOD53237.1 putative protein-disulfide isomerase [Aeromonas molluscorum 848]